MPVPSTTRSKPPRPARTATRNRTGGNTQTGNRPRRPPPKPTRRTRNTAEFRRGYLFGAGTGVTAATLVITIAAWLNPAGPDHLTTHHTQPTSATAEAATPPTAMADIEVSAEHLGNLQIRIDAVVTSTTGAPLTRAEVTAHTDMSAMPMSHRQGPIPLTETPGQPGHYHTTTTVAMPGDYDIHIQTHTPLQGETSHTITVGVINPDN